MCVALIARVQTRRVNPSDLGEKLPLLVNTAAGSSSSFLTRELEEAFHAVGVTVGLEWVAPENLAARVRWLVDQKAPAVAIGGGDGSISAAVDVLAGTKTLLVPVPLGTLNHFAGRYGIPTVEAALEALRSGSIVTIPIGRVNGHRFVNNASCGFYPHVVRYRERLRPWLSKWPAAFVAAVIVFARRPLLDIQLVARGR